MLLDSTEQRRVWLVPPSLVPSCVRSFVRSLLFNRISCCTCTCESMSPSAHRSTTTRPREPVPRVSLAPQRRHCFPPAVLSDVQSTLSGITENSRRSPSHALLQASEFVSSKLLPPPPLPLTRAPLPCIQSPPRLSLSCSLSRISRSGSL